MFRRRKEYSRGPTGPGRDPWGEAASAAWAVEAVMVRPPSYTCPYVSTPIVYLPFSLLVIAKKGEEKTTEFIFYTTAEVLDNKIIVRENYCVPRQKASSAFVSAEPGDCAGYNVVVHRHPPGVSDFSSIDDESINANNDVSILLEGGRVAAVEVRRVLPCGAVAHVRVPPDKVIFYAGTLEEALDHANAVAEEVLREVDEKLEPITYTSYYYDPKTGYIRFRG